MTYLLYNLLLLLVSPILVPYAFCKGLPYGNSWASLKERIGRVPRQKLAGLAGGRRFWVHAVSVGEVRAAQPLIRAVKTFDPSARVILSCVTFTGHQIAQTIDEVDLAIFLPFDLPFIVNRVLRKISPDVIIIIETELWPNFILCAHRKKIPLVLANGRISRKSFTRYLPVKSVISRLFECFSAICVQDVTSARRMRKIGAPVDKIHVTGNMKFDLVAETPDENSWAVQLQSSPVLRGRFIWVGGSTRSGEEELLVECHCDLLQAGLPSFLVLAPRHPERSSAIGQLLDHARVPFVLLSDLQKRLQIPLDCQSLIVDTVGELKNFYAIAEVVFVGGSLVPRGGHNILEPACFGKPVLFGPHMFNFREISRLVLNVGSGCIVHDGDELCHMLEKLHFDVGLRERMGAAGRQLISRNVGATALTMAKVRDATGFEHGAPR